MKLNKSQRRNLIAKLNPRILHGIYIPTQYQNKLVHIEVLQNEYGSIFGRKISLSDDGKGIYIRSEFCDGGEDGWDACPTCRGVSDVWDQTRFA